MRDNNQEDRSSRGRLSRCRQQNLIADDQDITSAIMVRWRKEAVLFHDLGPWITRAKAGDRDAIDKVVVSSSCLVIKRARSLHNKLPLGVDMEDIISAGFMGVLRGINTYPAHAPKWMSWVYLHIKSETNVLLDREYRRNRRSKKATTLSRYRDDLTVTSKSLDHGRPSDHATTISMTINNLPMTMQRVIRMRYGDGTTTPPMSIVEVATVMHKDRLWVRRVEADALRRMQDG